MLKTNKTFILIIIFLAIFLVDKLFAQSLDIGGSASFSYSNSADTGKSSLTQDMDDRFSHNYSLNMKKNITSDSSLRSSLRYSVDEGISSESENMDLGVDFSYKNIAFSLGWRDDVQKDFDNVTLSNSKTNNFGFRLSSAILPSFTFSYQSSVKDNLANSIVDSDNYSLSISKGFTILGNILSTSASYGDSRDSIGKKQSNDERFNMNYSIKLFDDKFSITTAYRIGSTYDLTSASNAITESGDASFGMSLLQNLSLDGNWSKNNNFTSTTGIRDVTSGNGFRLSFTPLSILNITGGVTFDETQTEDAIFKGKSENFSSRLTFPEFGVNYQYKNRETSETLTEDDSIDFSLDFGSLDIKDFTATAKYSIRKSNNFTEFNSREDESFGFGFSGLLTEELRFAYEYGKDKAISDVTRDNNESMRNAIRFNYNLKLLEGLTSNIGAAYTHTQSVSSASATIRQGTNFNGNFAYRLGEIDISGSGSLSRSFDDTGTSSYRTEWGTGIGTKIRDASIQTRFSFREDYSGGIANTGSKDYSINIGYPLTSMGSSSIAYTVTDSENFRDPTASKYGQRVSFTASFSF